MVSAWIRSSPITVGITYGAHRSVCSSPSIATRTFARRTSPTTESRSSSTATNRTATTRSERSVKSVSSPGSRQTILWEVNPSGPGRLPPLCSGAVAPSSVSSR